MERNFPNCGSANMSLAMWPGTGAGIPSAFGGAIFQILRRFFGTDDIPFTFVSDDFNGVTAANDGNVPPLIPRSFSTPSQAEEEKGQSRIYLGIHWAFDNAAGSAQGRQVGDYVFDNVFQPGRRHGRRAFSKTVVQFGCALRAR